MKKLRIYTIDIVDNIVYEAPFLYGLIATLGGGIMVWTLIFLMIAIISWDFTYTEQIIRAFILSSVLLIFSKIRISYK